MLNSASKYAVISLSLLLVFALALSPVLSWYAYAEESDEVQEVVLDEPRGDEDYRGAGSGDERREGAAQSESHSEVGTGAAEGEPGAEAEAEVVQEVSPGAVLGSGGNPDSGMDCASEDAYSGGPGLSGLALSGADSSGLGVTGDDGAFAVALGDFPSDFDPSDINSFPSWCCDSSINSYIGLDAETLEKVIDDLTELVNSGSATDEDIFVYYQATYALLLLYDEYGLSSSTYGWGTASTIINLFHSILSWANPQSSSDSKLATVITALVYGVGWDSNKNVYFPFDSTLKSKGLAGLISEAWGYNYSGTAIFYKNSPAAWLSNINTNVMGSFSRLGDISNGVGTQNNLLKAQWGYGFGGTVVVEEGSPFAKLKYIQESSLPHINDNLISAVRSLRQQWGYNYGTGDTIVYASNSPAGWLSNINTHVTGSFSRLGDISNGVGSQNNFLKEYVPSILDVLRSLDTNVTGSFSRLGDISNGVGSQNDLLRSFDSHLVSHSSLVSRGFFDVLAKLDNLNVSVGSVTVDNSGVESRLDDIRNLLLAAGVVENSKDIISALVGDFDMAKTSAAAARVEPFLSSLFPFCVPAIVKQVFGLLRHDPSTVLATVEVWGVPIDLDLTQFQLVADVSSWVARILFTVGLLVNSRKFVYTGGDSVC